MEYCRFSEDTYNIPKLDWLLGPFYDYYSYYLGIFKVDSWHQKWDCDDFTSLYKVLSQVCHRHSKGTAGGLAIAEIAFVRGPNDRHAIICAFTDKGPVFIEPQNGQQIFLTNDQKDSIYKCRM